MRHETCTPFRNPRRTKTEEHTHNSRITDKHHSYYYYNLTDFTHNTRAKDNKPNKKR